MINKYAPYMIPIIIAIVGIIYFYIDPELNIFMPKCPWWLLTDTYCPSCGAQRVFHHLLNGNVIMAFRTNPFLVLALPYAFLCVIGKWYNYRHIFDRMNRILYHRTTLIIYIILFFSWWIIRNIIGI